MDCLLASEPSASLVKDIIVPRIGDSSATVRKRVCVWLLDAILGVRSAAEDLEALPLADILTATAQTMDALPGEDALLVNLADAAMLAYVKSVDSVGNEEASLPPVMSELGIEPVITASVAVRLLELSPFRSPASSRLRERISCKVAALAVPARLGDVIEDDDSSDSSDEDADDRGAGSPTMSRFRTSTPQ